MRTKDPLGTGAATQAESGHCLSSPLNSRSFSVPTLVRKYKNIWPDSCLGKMCTACELRDSILETTTLSLRGLCRHSSFDTTYTVHYSPDSMVSYVGVKRTIISYNFSLNIWTMRDVTNPSVTAVSKASFRTLAIGNILWTISNDTNCIKGSDKTDLI